MLFTKFTNWIYSSNEVARYFLMILDLYIVWREYTFIGNINERMPEVKHYMPKKTFDLLKEINRKILLIQLISDSWRAAVQIIFSDEFAHISLWNLSLGFTGHKSETYTTCAFIFLTTCKEFFLDMPLNVYLLYVEEKLSAMQTSTFLLFAFCLQQIFQQFLVQSLLFVGSFFVNMSTGSLMISIVVLILTLTSVMEVLVHAILKANIKQLKNKKILRQLRPYLKEMNFSEENIYLFKTDHFLETPNAFTVGHNFLNNQKVVISDNIIGKNWMLNDCCSYKEVVSILMHELGHVYYHHMTKTVIMDLFIAISTSFIFLVLYQDIVFESFGFNAIPPVILGIFIRLDLLLSYNMVCGLVCMIYNRNTEYAADFFSYTLTGNYLCKALSKLYSIGMNMAEHDPWYSAWNEDHPSLGERLKFLKD
ncbi:hypothetical protein WDU94_006034 [Cyamophila willieti]